jgi:hypothetical protein
MAPLFLFVAILLLHILAPDLPNVIRYHLFGVSFVLGLALFGPKAVRNSTYTKEDLLAGYSFLVGFGIMTFWMCHVMYLLDAGILSITLSAIMGYLFSTVFPTLVVASFLTYEFLDSRQTRRTLTFRAKRFFGRVMFFGVYGLAVFLAVGMMTSLFGEAKLAVWLGFIVVSLGLLILVLRFRQFFDNIISGEW